MYTSKEEEVQQEDDMDDDTLSRKITGDDLARAVSARQKTMSHSVPDGPPPPPPPQERD